MIDDFKDRISGFVNAIDCGAGMGRVTKSTLILRFKNVDLLEPTQKQIAKAKKDVPEVRDFF